MVSVRLDIDKTRGCGVPELALVVAASQLWAFPVLMSFIRLEGLDTLLIQSLCCPSFRVG